MSKFRVDPDRVLVVTEACCASFRILEDARPTARLRSLGITGTGPMVLYVGGFSPHKYLERLVSVIADIAAQAEFSDVKLVMVGEYEKNPFYRYFGQANFANICGKLVVRLPGDSWDQSARRMIKINEEVAAR